MHKNHGKNQSHIREINQQLVLELLKEKPLSCKEMADILHLSNTALAKITRELKDFKLIIESQPPEKNEIGRRPIRLEINAKLGHIAIIDMENFFLKVFDFAGKMQHELTLPTVLVYDIEHLNNCIKLIKDFLKEKKIKNLLSVIVITSGRINTDGSFIYALRYKDASKINLKKMFEDNLNAPVAVKNDVCLALVSEYQNAQAQKPDSVVMLYLDKGAGCAFAWGGNVYEGNRGFAGEIGLIKDNLTGDILDNLISVRALIKLFEEAGHKLSLNQISQGFKTGEEQIVKVVNNFAKRVSKAIIDLLLILDTQIVLINGSIRSLGEGFLEIIRQELSQNQYLKTQVLYSKDENCTINGAFLLAQNLAISNIIKKA